MSKKTPREGANSSWWKKVDDPPPAKALPVLPSSEVSDGDTKPHRSRKARVFVPWWIYVVALSFLLLHLVEAFLVVQGPAYPEGMVSVFENGAMVIRSLASSTMFERAGLQARDRVLVVNGLPVRSPRDWAAVLANVEAGRPGLWEVLRNGDRIRLAVTFERASWKNRIRNGVPEYLATSFGFFVIGLFIGFSRPGDPVARIGSWLFLTASGAFGLLNGWAEVWRQTPTLVQFILWIPETSRFVIEGIFLSFFAVFPRRFFRSRWPWLVIWIPVLATLPWRTLSFYSVIYRPEQPATLPDWISQVIFLRTMIYVVAGLVLLIINYLWLADSNEKRRIRVLVVGTVIGLVSAAQTTWIYNSQGYGVQSLGPLLRLVPSLILACPFAFAYAILRHRVLDIQVIIRQGLQYALARGAVLGVVPALAAILVLDLGLNSEESLARVLQARGWVYAGVGGLAIAASLRRKQWLETIDRHFFREHYDSRRILREIVEEVRNAISLESVAARVVARIETALHPEFVSFMIHKREERAYRSLALVPAGRACAPMVDSKLAALLRVLAKPLEVLLGDSVWLQQRLPEAEISFIKRERIDLLVPVESAPGEIDAVLVLGIKRSEEPYTREDQDLLEVIASSLARLVEQPIKAPVSIATDTFKECPQCGDCYDKGVVKCAVEGETLATVHLSRTVVGRYRLERRLGSGGMGTVYAATDTALERRVALKVIREDLLSSPALAQRFHREAKAAAALTHPNVVNVHDFGVEAGNRAYLVMELLEGCTLRNELDRYKRLEISRIGDIFRSVCAAVEAAHARHLIHRDLKPENIFLVRTAAAEIVKVLDFGIAKVAPLHDTEAPTRVTAETQTGMLLGTPGYMSPEQLLGEKPATSWDLWALAVVAYEMYAGAMPFPQHFADWRAALMTGRFTPLSEHLPDPPPQWQLFFSRSFAPDRTARPKSAAEFLRRLEAALL